MRTKLFYIMKIRYFVSVAAAVLLAVSAWSKDYASYVNPMIGTDNHGHVAVGGSVPFGLVMMGPVNMKQGWDWCSGYCVDDNTIIGFSPIHLSGTGCCDLGDIIFMPTTGGVNKWRGSEDRPNSGHSSLFRHETANGGAQRTDLTPVTLHCSATRQRRQSRDTTA